ncbi:MAG: site-specific DNA-methyltransferase, partial [Candidatus Pacebacteria bacterium]|nr:site-specific DNA-methyltransferase [Candidatus Paceibacterota bacterium]
MAQTENQKKLLKILNEIFQLDQSDLDFGIYRIMNTKSKEINEFLDNDLLSSVASAFSSNDNSAIQKELDELIKTLTNAGMNADDSPKVQELKDSLSSSSTSSNLENEVFSHLANFFKRYYKDGDFVSLRRYKKDTYAIPYEGEEVKLHWANSDQYYIKSGEYFRDYSFKAKIITGFEGDKEKTIHFKLSDAETEQNNNKSTGDKERRFVILEDNPCEVIDDELYINFEYKAIGKENQDKLNEKAITKALESIEDLEFLTALNELAPTEKNKKRTIFEKHLKSYTSRNSFDYFIHKDLGGFLGRELDFYIKNEMLFLDDIQDSEVKYSEVMGKIKIFKEVSQKVIAFLTQLEELQKKLWEKKKFIIETNYCITLDKIDEKYYEQILACDEQKEEWKSLFDVDVKTIADLKDEKYLVLDTQFFDMKFKYKLLSEFDNLDEEIDGVLINSENFGALNLLQDRYKEQIKTVYIDPPYNAPASEVLYLNNYKHSSWLSLIDNRINLAKPMMNTNDSVFTIAIDENEQERLGILLESIFSGYNKTCVAIEHNPSGQQSDNFSFTHEFAYFIYPKAKRVIGQEVREDDFDKRNFRDVTGDDSLRIAAKNCFYPIYINDGKIVKFGDVSPDDYHPNSINIEQEDGLIAVYPIDPQGIERKWRFARQTVESIESELHIKFIKKRNVWDIERHKNTFNFKTLWKNSKYSANNHGTQILNNIIGKDLFAYPKSINTVMDCLRAGLNKNNTGIILDFFAGSGTTGHAVMNLNRKDNGNRKYILVEMGEYFNTATKPRIQKVIYSDSWKDGKPTTKKGISQIFKYFKLESYEDTLNNLEFKKTKEQQKTLDFHPKVKEDYMINYSLDVESQGSLLNIDTFSTPFDYKLKIATSSVGETKDTAIDLV